MDARRRHFPYCSHVGFVSQKDNTALIKNWESRAKGVHIKDQKEEQRRQVEGREDNRDILNILAPVFLLDINLCCGFLYFSLSLKFQRGNLRLLNYHFRDTVMAES